MKSILAKTAVLSFAAVSVGVAASGRHLEFADQYTCSTCEGMSKYTVDPEVPGKYNEAPFLESMCDYTAVQGYDCLSSCTMEMSEDFLQPWVFSGDTSSLCNYYTESDSYWWTTTTTEVCGDSSSLALYDYWCDHAFAYQPTQTADKYMEAYCGMYEGLGLSFFDEEPDLDGCTYEQMCSTYRDEYIELLYSVSYPWTYDEVYCFETHYCENLLTWGICDESRRGMEAEEELNEQDKKSRRTEAEGRLKEIQGALITATKGFAKIPF